MPGGGGGLAVEVPKAGADSVEVRRWTYGDSSRGVKTRPPLLPRAPSRLSSLSLSRARAMCPLSLSAHTPTHHIFPILLSHTDLFCLLHRQHISCRPIRCFFFFFVLWVRFDSPTLPPVSYWLVGSVSLCFPSSKP